MVDLHTHLLPDIDDGADTLETALEMTEILYKQNINKVVCTPHFDPYRMDLTEFIAMRNTAMKRMSASRIILIPGSETILHEYLFHYTDLSDLCIEKTRYLLLELPYSKKWDYQVFTSLKRIIDFYDIIPIIAHIDRYPAVKYKKSLIMKLVDYGCLMQLNTSAILDRKKRKWACRYIKEGYIDVLGSDCHDLNKRPPNLAAAFGLIRKKLGAQYYEQLAQNSECIADNSFLAVIRPFIID